MEYLSVREAAAKWNLKAKTRQIMCAEGRIEGAVRIRKYLGHTRQPRGPADGRVWRQNIERHTVHQPVRHKC